MEKVQPRDVFFNSQTANRGKILENEEKLTEIKNLFENLGYGFGGWDERTMDIMILSLYSILMNEKNIFTHQELEEKIKEIKEITEMK
jgi:hypothetical protein